MAKTEDDGGGPPSSGRRPGRRRPTSGAAQAKRQAWGREWSTFMRETARQVREKGE